MRAQVAQAPTSFAALASAALIAGLTGCGGHSQEAQLSTAVHAYSDAYLSGDGQGAYALLSSRCKQRISLPQMQNVAQMAKQRYGPIPILKLTMLVEQNLARATYSYTAAALTQTSEPWVLENDRWTQDDC